jgi:CheY-like chemotaxis protein
MLPAVKKTVLVIDDDPDILRTVCEILEDEGYGVQSATDGRDALTKLRSSGSDLILLDMMMPGMNGWQFREAQKSDPQLARIPVVVFSADRTAAPGDPVEAAGYLQKPIRLDDLLAAVALHIA